jgi:GntR family transcriptional regulator
VPVPDLADPRPPYLQIADELRRQITTGHYQPGERLPSLPTMTAQYSSASETVRRALRVLRDEGLVATQSTRGTFVLKSAGEPEPDPRLAKLEAALQEAEARLSRHVDSEIAQLRERVEYDEARIEALETASGGEDAVHRWRPG